MNLQTSKSLNFFIDSKTEVVMTLISFIIPTDKDILKDLNEESRTIKFVGSAIFSQKLDQIKFSRTFKHRFDNQNQLKQVIYFRKGLIWKFNEVILCTELAS
ncbi:MAG: hypothetical protein COB73_01190 [Flavobacteriaceae bacterium]|nr:MAG: hypothetical protein COB73_01190 [Flavobacteriaceae bacterium]